MRHQIIFFSLILTLGLASSGWGQKGLDTSAPIQIEADRMETFQEKNIVVFTGQVQAQQNMLSINADEMTVHYMQQGAGADGTPRVPAQELQQKIETITARGSVKIVQDEWVAAGDSMDFNAEKRIVTLSGNAKAWQDQNMVSGEKIIIYLDEGRSVVEQGGVEGDRVRAFIYPSSQKKSDKKSP